MRDRESIELGFGPACWHRLSAVAGPPRPLVAPTPPAGRVSDAVEPAAAPGLSHVPAPSSARIGTSDDARVRAEVEPTRGSGSDSTPAVVAGWVVVVAALLALVEYWRWVVIGLVVLVGLSVLGVLLEWRHARRHEAETTPVPTPRLPGR